SAVPHGGGRRLRRSVETLHPTTAQVDLDDGPALGPQPLDVPVLVLLAPSDEDVQLGILPRRSLDLARGGCQLETGQMGAGQVGTQVGGAEDDPPVDRFHAASMAMGCDAGADSGGAQWAPQPSA